LDRVYGGNSVKEYYSVKNPSYRVLNMCFWVFCVCWVVVNILLWWKL